MSARSTPGLMILPNHCLKKMMTLKETLCLLEELGNSKNVDGMKHFGIQGAKMLGISVTKLREVAKTIKTDHSLALELWATGIHEARILACLIDDVKQVTPGQMDAWIADFDSWDVCDQACNSLFYKHPSACDKIFEWSEREPEFERRAGFALMACYAWHDKKAPDEKISAFFPLIEKRRNFVKKAVNWALRQIGKRNANLCRLALDCARRIQLQDSKSAKWIASDAIRELEARLPELG